MQKRQYCTWGTVFSPVPSKGRTAQGMDCEDLSEKYPTYTKHLCLWCPLRWRETSRYFSVPARFVWTKPARKERLSHVDQAARFLDEVEMDVDGNISREAGRLQINLQRQLMKRKIPSLGRQRSRPPIGVEN